MSQPTGQRTQAFAALVFVRLLDTIALVMFGMLFWFWDEPPFGNWLAEVMLILLVDARVVLMEPYGISGSQAIALSLFGLIVHLVLAVIGGLLEFEDTNLPNHGIETESNIRA